MFLKNAWYCAGWDSEFDQGRDAIIARKIAGERVVLYRRPDGRMVALEDRCPHRQAALSLGRKEGNSLRCMYHGMKFDSEGRCEEIPGQAVIPERACVRHFPVVEKNNWVWVWMGDPVKADESLICFAVGPSDPNWHIKPSKMHVETHYRWEIENLADLSHLTWVHEKTVGGDPAYGQIKPTHTLTPRGVNTLFWVRSVAPTGIVAHLFPPDMKLDICFDIQHTVPCNWVMRFRAFSAGTRTEGESNGQLILDSWTCQAVTPCDEDSVDYYYSWGASKETEFPGMSDLLGRALDQAFTEDRIMLEAQHLRRRERPDMKLVNITHDAGPGKMLWVLDKLIREEAQELQAQQDAQRKSIPVHA
ncbi:vanillate O-demethylase oxygenase [Methylibium sp. Pch-M]|uniref:aromatic ring-hydroxylating dioxygenase subunit alpha n=1 Tax=Methylibium sp. Pch-M TaxID=2082386 RepID=UPI0010102BFE|nr:aromatic ring-hydroxylating dioxygenase subunit alpha [Methylibium sp. Pch-M]QAZ40372.1 vanillate O-demethylase oxygenase [Methylibium sp. Pch-M]